MYNVLCLTNKIEGFERGGVYKCSHDLQNNIFRVYSAYGTKKNITVPYYNKEYFKKNFKVV